MSETINHQGIKKKTKKRKKGKSGKGSGGPSTGDVPTSDQRNSKMPKQVSEKEDQVITTTKCHRCKGTFRQMIIQSDASVSLMQSANWMCPSCVQEVKLEEEKYSVKSSAFHSSLPPRSTTIKDSLTLGSGGCNCNACVAKRENAVSPEVERDAHITQTYWMEIRHVVRCIYRDNMSLNSQSNRTLIGSDKMRMIVKKLCSRDPHQFFQRLETLAREYLLEVKVRLLEQLSCGFNSSQLAIEFIQMLLEEYSTLCNSLPALLYLLKPLEDCDYVQKLGMTIELMNKNIFRELIFAESFMSSNLPLIIAQLRLASLASDHFHRSAADELSQRYIALDREMEEISQIWKSAKDLLNNQQLEDRQSHFEKIKADGESFKQQVKLQHSVSSKSKSDDSQSKEVEKKKSTKHIPCDNTDESISNGGHSTNGVLNPNPIQALLQSQMDDSDEFGPSAFKSKQAAEWSRLLFKCIKPVGEPDFQLNGDIATHTITLHLDMTQLDLADSKPSCTRSDLMKYRRLGLTVEEIVEVAMKLSALKTLGINLKIEDLFDDEGFSLSDINETVVGSRSRPQADDVYFLDSDSECDPLDEWAEESGRGSSSSSLSLDEEIDLQKAKEKVLSRQEGNGHPVTSVSSLINGGKTRQHDFLQGMTMKIRFMKRLTVEDLDKHFIADGGKVIFSSCDQVQMKLTQLELSSVRLITSSDSLGDDLGLDCDPTHLDLPPMNPLSANHKTPEDYVFVHTDSHREFMDLLLEKRKQLESTISQKEKERRNLKKEASDCMRQKDGCKNPDIAANLPRYHVRDQQESFTSQTCEKSTENQSKDDIKSTSFKPLYLSKGSKPCQCSACVGAVATIITPNYQKGLNGTSSSTITIECSLSTHLESDQKSSTTTGDTDLLVRSKTSNVNVTFDIANTSESSTSPLSKEGLWQNWMSTSGSAQLENESHVANGNHHHGSYHHCHYNEGGEYQKRCESEHAHSSGSSGFDSHSQSGTCGNHHSNASSSSSSCINKDGGTHESGSSHNFGNGPGSSSGEVPRRYCPCCYCELFGHNVPPTAPTSQNYTKRRDIMRHKLEEKKKKQKEHDGSKSGNGQRGKEEEQQTSVEELLAFIEGGECEEGEQNTSSKASKRQKKKQKKQQTSNFHGNEGRNLNDRVTTPDHFLFHHLHQGGSADVLLNSLISGDHTRREKTINGPHLHENSQHINEESAELNGDEYDNELEEFKKFCFADAPAGPRIKMAIPLKMSDIMSKIK